MKKKSFPKPFYSALAQDNVKYYDTPRDWLNRLNSILYTLTVSPFLRLMVSLSTLVMSALMVCFVPYLAPISFGLLFLAKQHRDFIDAQQRKNKYLSKAKVNAPTAPHPMLKIRKQQTFNHVFSFIKHKGHIWYALRSHDNLKPSWKILYVDHLNCNAKQFDELEIIADGQNLMLRLPQATHDDIFYKKIIAEHHNGKIYTIENLCEEPYAIDSWFTLPFFSYFKPQQLGKRLRVAKGAQWAMSNAAEYKRFVVDDRGIAHQNLPITTVYEYHQGKMRLHDPFVEQDSVYSMSLPPMLKENEHIEASASILFATSKRSQKAAHPTLRSIYLDYDSEGLHPLISFTFDNNDTQKRLLPINNTKSHRIPIAIKNITNITALQSSFDPHSIEIRISDSDSKGFYFKNLEDEHWYFHSDETNKVSAIKKHHKTTQMHQPDILKTNTQFKLADHHINQVEVHDFDENSTFCPVIFKEEKAQYHFLLRRHQDLIRSFIGMPSHSWTLNKDPAYKNDPLLPIKLPMDITLNWNHNRLLLKSNQAQLDLELQSNDKKRLSFSNS
ncbi:MAG: hypothetical protein AB7V32_00140 [Candidatus Berkiella sp.]